MKKCLVVLGLLVLAAPALADLSMATPEPVKGFVSTGSGHLRTNPSYAPIYDNTVNGPTNAYSQNPGNEIGDEVLVDRTSCPNCLWLDSIDFSVYNGGAATAAITSADITLKIYNSDGASPVLIGQLDYTGVTFGTGGLLPGYFTTLSLSDLYDTLLAPEEPDPTIYEIPLVNVDGASVTAIDYFLVTATLTNVDAGALPGQVLMNPPALGASGNYFYKNGSWLWFGSTGPVCNFYWGLGGVAPEPASLALLGLASLVVLRRRR